MPGHSVDFKGTDRTQRIKAAASKKGEVYEKYCKLNPPESKLSNGKDATRRNIIVSPNESTSGDDFWNSYWVIPITIVLFLGCILLTNLVLGL